MEISIGGVDVKQAEQNITRFAMLIWGVAGCGKTTLAATAPGKKLWLNFDDGGTDSIAALKHTAPENSALANDILVADFSHERNNIIDKFKRDDGLGLGKYLGDDEIGIDTVVVDSTTRLSQMALEHMIAQGIHKSARLELPGMGSYGGRNALLLRMFVDVMNVTGKYNKNVIFISHEAEPKTNDDGHVLAITMALGGQLPSLTTQKLGEVYYMSDIKGERRIHLRPFRVYKPMKSRMWDLGPDKPSDFVWKYDIHNPDPEYEIATWYKRWRTGGGQKLSLPK